MITLKVTSGPATGQSLELESELVIGRENADLTIADAEMSRRHAVMRPVDGAVEVEDLGSMNGTFVDEERITDPRTLTASAIVRLGTSRIAVDVPIAAADVTRPSPIMDVPTNVTAPSAIPQEPAPPPPAPEPPLAPEPPPPEPEPPAYDPAPDPETPYRDEEPREKSGGVPPIVAGLVVGLILLIVVVLLLLA
jgi:hypothetical protein